jgi:tRNA(Ile)-lysidine synthase
LREFNPAVEEQLGQLADFFAADEDYWQEEIERLLPSLAEAVTGGWSVPLAGLEELPAAVRTRLLRRLLTTVRGTPLGLSWRQFGMLEKVAASSNPHAEASLPGCWVARDYERLWLLQERPIFPEPFSLSVEGPGEVIVPGSGRLVVALTTEARGEDRWNVEFAADRLAFPLTIRSYAAGDRFRPAGLDGEKKIKELFIDLKLPWCRRHGVPLVLTGKEILWVAGLRRSALYPAGEKTTAILRLTFVPAPVPANLPL